MIQVVWILMIMKIKDLCVLFVVDVMKGCNGVGVYFQDLVVYLDGVVVRVELVLFSLEDFYFCQGLFMLIFGDFIQCLFLLKMCEFIVLVWEMKFYVIVIFGLGIFFLGVFWVVCKLGILVCVIFQIDYDSLVCLYWGLCLVCLVGGLFNWVNCILFQGSSVVVIICESLIVDVCVVGVCYL